MIHTSEDLKSVQQPLDKDGWSNDNFDKLYPKSKNPYKGTDRDRTNRKGSTMQTIADTPMARVFWDSLKNVT